MTRLLAKGFTMSTGPDSAVEMPNAIFGKTIVLRSLKVNSQILYRWYENEREYSEPRSTFKGC